MKKFAAFALAAALCAPAFAQRMGSANNDAPQVKQTISQGDVQMSLNYTSITWSEGRMMKMLADKEKGGRARARVNNTAPNNPLASFKTSVPCKVGGLTLDKGSYEVYFTIDDDAQWHLNFHADGQDAPQTMKLALMKNAQPHKRLLMSLYAGDESGCGCYVAFGSQFALINFEPTVADAKK